MLMLCACCCVFVVVLWVNVALIMYVIDIVAAEHERGPPSRHQRSMRSWAQAKAKAKTRAQRAQKHLSLAFYRVRSLRRNLNNISVLSLLRRRPSEGAESSATSQAAGKLRSSSCRPIHPPIVVIRVDLEVLDGIRLGGGV